MSSPLQSIASDSPALSASRDQALSLSVFFSVAWSLVVSPETGKLQEDCTATFQHLPKPLLGFIRQTRIDLYQGLQQQDKEELL